MTLNPEAQQGAIVLPDDGFFDLIPSDVGGGRYWGLEVAEVNNLDARIEWFPEEDVFLAFGVFRKEVDGVIERISLDALPEIDSGLPFNTFVNNENQATLLGYEIEVEGNLRHLEEKLDFISLGGNVAFIRSKVRRSDLERAVIEDNAGRLSIPEGGFDDNRQVQDQPDFLATGYMNLEIEPTATDLTISLNRIGRRLDVPATGRQPDIFLEAYNQVNFVLTQQIPGVEGLAFQFSAKNITNPKIERIAGSQNSDLKIFDEKGNEVDELALESFRAGIDYSFGLSYTF